jgi:hypothetical protein
MNWLIPSNQNSVIRLREMPLKFACAELVDSTSIKAADERPIDFINVMITFSD